MTDIPQDLIAATEKSEDVQIKHNWMYSFLPVTVENLPYLVAYCKMCDTGMSVRMMTKHGKTPTLAQLGVPKWGCKPVNEL